MVHNDVRILIHQSSPCRAYLLESLAVASGVSTDNYL